MKVYGFQSVVSRAALIGSVALFAMAAAPAGAQTTPADGASEESVDIVVNGSRLPESLQSYPGSVTRIDPVEVEAFRSFTSDPGQLLGMMVPGLGTSAPGSASNFEQSLRGRTPAVLIDGVPIGTSLRDGRHDIRSLSLSVIESVEVIRGASALYGNGGAGGVINYITKSGGDEQRFESEIGTQASITHFGDSLAPFVRQSALGKVGPFDYNVEGYAEFTRSQFDAEGDRIRPSPNQQGGLADSSIYNLFAKIGSSFGNQRIEGSVLYYKQVQDTDYNRIINGDVARRIKTTVEKAPPFAGAANEANKNFAANLVYTNSDLWGTRVRAQVYYQDYMNIFVYDPNDFLTGGQSQILSEKYGARLDLNTPFDVGSLITGGSVLWGVDFVNDSTIQGLVDGRAWVPPVTQESLAGFIQVTAPIGDRLTVRGGFRYEDISVSNEAFMTLRRRPTDVSIAIPAGQRSFTAKVFNVGASYDIVDNVSLFAAYSQGFSTAELGRVLRDTRVALDLSDPALDSVLKPQKVDNYEAGTRLNIGSVNIEAVAFLSKCSLCSTIGSDLRLTRKPDETFGYEISITSKPSGNTRWGASFTFVDGNQDSNSDGSFETPLPSNRVPPDKVTAYVEHDFNDMWTLRVQGLHSRARDQFGNQITSTAVGVAPVEGFTLVDASLRMDLKRAGVVTLGVNNLFNEDYFLIGSYLLNRPDRFSKGPGTTVRLAYTLTY